MAVIAAQIDAFRADLEFIEQFVKRCMIDGIDFGTVVGDKPVLLLPGAQKLQQFFKFTPEMFEVDVVVDLSGKDHGEPYVYFRHRCKVRDPEGRIIGDAYGSGNSWEGRYRYRWVSEDKVPQSLRSNLKQFEKRTVSESVFVWQYEKRETGGKHGRANAYWLAFDEAIAEGTAKLVQLKQHWNNQLADAWVMDMASYRIPNPDLPDLENTVSKISQKRAYVGAILMASGFSSRFTQDLEDNGDVQSWEPDWSTFVRTVAGGLPKILAGAVDSADQAKIIKTVLESKFSFTSGWDERIATDAHAYLLEVEKLKTVDEREEVPEKDAGAKVST